LLFFPFFFVLTHPQKTTKKKHPPPPAGMSPPTPWCLCSRLLGLVLMCCSEVVVSVVFVLVFFLVFLGVHVCYRTLVLSTRYRLSLISEGCARPIFSFSCFRLPSPQRRVPCSLGWLGGGVRFFLVGGLSKQQTTQKNKTPHEKRNDESHKKKKPKNTPASPKTISPGKWLC